MKLSIRVKWTALITLLLASSTMCTGYFMLKGVFINQKTYDEALLLENSKTANLYIREQYGSMDYKDFAEFYREQSSNLAIDLERMFQLPVTLYDREGDLLSGEEDMGHKQSLTIMKQAVKDTIAYEKTENKIIYLAPVYDFDTQIGVIKIIYDTIREDELYQSLQELFIKIGLIFTTIAAFIGIFYFNKVAKNVKKLKEDVEAIELGKYDSIKMIQSDDELGDLNKGIILMADKIKDNINDLTDEKNKLEITLDKVRKLEKQQKEFIGNITHEFKTPLTVIKAQIDLITMYMDDKVMVQKCKQVADKELKRMDGMIQNILYLSKLEKYDFEFQKEKVDTKEILEEICYRMEGKATKFNIEIVKQLSEAAILIDRESFMQIFINLIDNAIKYNKNGGYVYVRSHLEAESVVIQVEDTGIGIPVEFKDRVFETFFTVDKNRSKQFSGTGLGLSLVHKLIKCQGGDIILAQWENGVKFKIVFQKA